MGAIMFGCAKPVLTLREHSSDDYIHVVSCKDGGQP